MLQVKRRKSYLQMPHELVCNLIIANE